MSKFLSGFDIDKYKNQKPPQDNSLATFKELKEINSLREDPVFVKDKDNQVSAFKKIATKNGLSFPKDLVKSLIEETAPKVLDLKNYFNRSRPKNVAGLFGIKLKDVKMDSMKTPSYPSGHSVQGVLIGKALGKLYPQHKNEFEKEGQDISLSRRIGRAHFKSDSVLGEKIGNDMFNYIKDKI